ncbi:MAG TPA: protease inhibitor I42 family protein [Vitreimonas sp.]|uniref:protease inhibitor I42 family protein n=1 Tax=Vitreimonas sp. TaxID=3069702 RepID=UPI002D346BF5|nr:protease inhibitor I42 family protein [Vitreimonas sp.]HYD87048.1 protease inhibitor I42 family protein [Vitreimonas sp.]
MMRQMLVACALALCACTPAQEAKEEAPVADGSLPAPTPQDVATRITADQNGQTIEVAVNQRFAVELVGVPTAGYIWAPATLPAFVQRAGEASGNTIQEQSQPGYAGGNHWEVLMFVATAPSTGELVLEQRRPWESDEPATDTFRVTIVAR